MMTNDGSIVSAYTPLFLFLESVRDKGIASTYEYAEIRAKVVSLFNRSLLRLQTKGVNPRLVDCARFALCACVDEVMLGISWNGRDNWQRNSLQMQFYGVTNGGEEVYRKLEEVGRSGADIKEFYLMIFVAGFRGKFNTETGSEKIYNHVCQLTRDLWDSDGLEHREGDFPVAPVIHKSYNYRRTMAVILICTVLFTSIAFSVSMAKLSSLMMLILKETPELHHEN